MRSARLPLLALSLVLCLVAVLVAQDPLKHPRAEEQEAPVPRKKRIVVEEEDVAPPKRKVAAAEPPSPFVPDPASVQRYGPAYRYPQAGWIVLHVEGKPYERGYQHGKLLAPEIAAHVRCFAAMNGPSAPAEAWRQTRLLANALFLRRFDPEYLEEMKGIADGAAAAGAKFDNRPIDLTDVAALNLWAEIETLPGALEATPTGLEGKLFPHEQPKAMPRPKPEHCSAFAAAGPATADGQIVFGHITMFALYPATLYNVWLDLKPEKGRRVLMQTYPGGIQSGMDYYLNDAGLLVCETTIRQTRFHGNGEVLASRIRKALQYADSIDGAVRILREGNNGLYTNEWLLADVKTNEIAMFELGTHKSKLWRSSKNEWYGNTPGFYWGCNNTKDLEVRLETLASVEGRPANVVFRPSDRDKCWQRLYREHKGKIDADFGKLAFTTPPVAAYHSLDAKFTTTDLARGLKTWALFGPPLGKTWQPTPEERKRYPETRPLVSNPWTVLHAEPPAKGTKVAAVDLKGRLDPAEREPDRRRRSDDPPTVPAWHGTILPRSDADVWLAAAFSDYERYCAREKALRQQAGATGLSQEDRERLAVDLFAYRSSYLAAARAAGDVALARTRSGVTEDHWYRIAAGKGVLLLHELRKQLGDAAFGGLMEQFGRANAGKPVSAAQFQELAERVSGKKLGDLFDAWLQRPGLPKEANGAAYSVLSFLAELDRTLIVYGTADEFHANREAAEALQRALVERGPNITVPIRADRGVTDEELKGRHLLLIGRPDSNSVVGRFRDSWPVRFGSRSFVVGRDTYAHMNSAVVFAADNPLNPRYSAVVIAGLSARATYRTAAEAGRNSRAAEAVVFPDGGKPRPLVLPARELVRDLERR